MSDTNSRWSSIWWRSQYDRDGRYIGEQFPALAALSAALAAAAFYWDAPGAFIFLMICALLFAVGRGPGAGG